MINARMLFLYTSILLNISLLFLLLKHSNSKLFKFNSERELPKTTETIVAHHAFKSVGFIHEFGDSIIYQQLPAKLIIPKGVYSYSGKSYNLRKQGVYRFITPEIKNEQRIVYSNSIDTILSSIAWISIHGNRHDKLDFKSLQQMAKSSKLSLTCGPISKMAVTILNSLGYDARFVMGLTLDKWNTYDNGHSLIEVFRTDYDKWVVYDLDNNCYTSYDGVPLSIIELSNHIKVNKPFDIIKIAIDTKLDIGYGNSDKYNFSFFSELIISSDKTLKNWYSRVLQVPLIKSNGLYYFHDEKSSKRVLKYSKHFVKVDNFRTFYSKFYKNF